MASGKRSAQVKRQAAFESAYVAPSDAFAREEERREALAAQRDADLRQRACSSKNRYQTYADAQEAIGSCADHGRGGLHCYRCDYCGGWHLTSKPPQR